ncbi:metal-binding protein [Vibrio sp. vnigr-6D03]|uniref:DNA-binding protein n=1 Tax=Vibrio penaeicida TaxID=104609 RepID=A0AAV5NRS6_9VIBR|nr:MULTISPECIES: YheV family putative zinc ribbon protein [Vibrio]MDP2575783.1 YheV family putative zinc ribbon protein [Vibrio penaeicida]PKF80607.1 metal-binding protein [Vibrio sp. vnigr-6D03]RTZ25070.1 YheV family putative metal-binding protein [Vibrio penaeicida]GLQ73341.1 DNA-binding protein [Vibrio penaeicida]
MKLKKRFIAGAACPQCKEKDTLRWWEENSVEVVECVDCDYVEQRTTEAVEKSEHAAQDMIGIFKPD